MEADQGCGSLCQSVEQGRLSNVGFSDDSYLHGKLLLGMFLEILRART
jgi:hypothetical protein